MQQERNIKAMKLAVRQYWQQMRQDWPYSFPAVLLTGIGTVFVIYIPTLVVAKVLSRFSNQPNTSFRDFVPYILLFALVWAVGELLWRVAGQFLAIAELRGLTRLYNQALEELLKKDLAFFHDNFAGSLTKKALGYARRYEEFLDVLSFEVFPNIIPLGFASFILWHYSPWLVLALWVMLIVTTATVVPFIRRRYRLVVMREEASNSAAGYIADVLANSDTVKAFGKEKFEIKGYRAETKDFMAKTKASWYYQNLKINAVASPFYVFVNTIGLAIALAVTRGSGETLQVVFVTFSYYTATTRIIWDFNGIYRRIETVFTDAAQFTEMLTEPPRIVDAANAKDFKVKSGEIELRNISFKYSDSSGEHLFRNLNLKIAAGEKIALVGHSGGGKTTITRLLLRFMDVDDGQILIDGQNIAKVKQSSLRENVAYVPQEPAMFHRTLADNIRYGQENASDEEVKRVAKLAHASEFIDKLPMQYETLVGERGVKLSGGQRQRVAIARAMIKQAPLLILDEATSSLDSESEKYIQDALWKLMEGRTAIVIAHRLSTIQRMDRIIVLEDGKIVEQGSHKELLENKGIYAGLWAHQSGGFIEE